MGERAISVDDLGKRYTLGQRAPYKTVRASLHGLVGRALEHGRDRPAPQAREELWAVRNLCFEVDRGEVLGIIGHNGAGKSTLLKLLSRVTNPTEGRAVIRGSVSALLEVGTGFHPELTGRENVYLNGSVLGMRHAAIAKKFDDIVDFAEVARFIDTPIKRYSTGMQMRLAFAVAAHLEPEILIVDEVLAVGDAAFQRKCLARLEEQAQLDRTVLFVSHNLPAIRTLCTRALVLEGGHVIFDGPAAQAVDRYVADREIEASDPVDLGCVARSRGVDLGGGVRFSAIKFPKPGPYALGDDLVLEIEFVALRPVQDVVLVLNIFSVEDVLVAQSVTTNEYPPIHALAEGSYSISVTIRSLALQPGRYAVGLAARSASKLEDELHPVAFFDVVESVDLESPWFGGPGGYVRLSVDWERPRHASSAIQSHVERSG